MLPRWFSDGRRETNLKDQREVMPLLDHFHPPLSVQRHWHSFHNAWAANLAAGLNETLPENYFAESNVQFGIEIDVATWEVRDLNDVDKDDSGTQTWTPPAPLSTIPLPMDEDVAEVLVYSMDAGPVLVGAIELVSPANKDRPASRQVFVDKCAAYLHSGIGLALVDIVTNRQANLHDQLWRYLNSPTASPLEGDLYATAYRPIQQDGKSMLQVWASPLALDSELPVLPLWLRNGPCVPIDLEKTDQRTCREQRIRLAT